MRILLVSAKFPPPDTLGAVAGLLDDMVDEFQLRGNETSVIALSRNCDPSGKEDQNNVVRITKGPGLLTVLKLARTIASQRENFDIIHIHDIIPWGILSLWFLSIINKPKILTIHTMGYMCRNSFLWPPASFTRDITVSHRSPVCHEEVSPECRCCFKPGFLGWMRYVKFYLYRSVAAKCLRRFVLISPSLAAKDVVMKSLGLRSRVIWNSIRDRQKGMETRIRSPYPLFIPVIAGRAVPEKGFYTLLKAISRMKWPHTSLSALVKGKSSYINSIKKTARCLGIHVNWLEWQPRKEYLRKISSSSVCIIPTSGFEVFGMTALDSQMMGVPLIVADAGALPEVSLRGLNASIFPKQDWRALAKHMDQIAKSPKLCAKMGKMSRKIFEVRYRIQGHVGKLLEVYDKAQKSNAPFYEE